MPNEARSCRVAVFSEVGQPLKVQQVLVPAIRDNEVLVRVTCCTICGSDLHTFYGRRSGPTPSILGHEIIGTIEQIEGTANDAAGNVLDVGDRVTWSVAASCGCCGRCESGIPQKCETLFKYGHADFSDASPLVGGLAEYCLLRAGTSIVRLPNGVPDEVLCPANCATATSMAAVRAAGSLTGKQVLIYGAGMLGLTTSAIASSMGAASVAVIDPNETRLARAVEFGATHTNKSKPNEAEWNAFDVVFEMSGNSAAVEQSISVCGVGGTVVLVGSVFPSPPVPVDAESVVRRLLSIRGVHNYAPIDLIAAVDFLSEFGEQFPFAGLVESALPLERVNEAFTLPAGSLQPIRVAIAP